MNFQRVEPMRYNNYLQDCIHHLQDHPEYDSDISLVYLVRIQRLTERISELNSKDRAAEEISPVPSAPISAYILAFQNELNHIRDSMPNHLKEDSKCPDPILVLLFRSNNSHRDLSAPLGYRQASLI